MRLESFLALLAMGAAPPSPSTSATAPPAPQSCPSDMRLVVGTHYDQVERFCTDFRHEHCFAFFPFLTAYESKVTPVRACMDTYEWPNQAGSEPVVMLRFVEAEAACAAAGKRLCSEVEWETACEGPETLPFPYGFRYEAGACNSDKTYRPVSEARLASSDAAVRDAETRRAWQGEPSGSHPRCESAYGVFDLTGNVEEWVQSSRPEWPYRSALKGGYWSKPWAGCRGTNESHGPQFRFYEVGFRCCKDPS